MARKYVDASWDFREANTKTYTHCYHAYPAMMIPQVAGRLLDLYGAGAKLLFDPYCGTGTSLVEANLRGIDAMGTDLNPMAVLIARSKTTIPDMDALNHFINRYEDEVLSLKFGLNRPNVETPTFKNIDFWFSKEAQIKLAIIKEFIIKIDDGAIADFFKVAFSEAVRESSYTRKGEFKLFRIPQKKMETFRPDVYGIMLCKLKRNYEGLAAYMKDKKNNSSSMLFEFNTVEGLPPAMAGREIDIIVTSPPYGDSHTTVAYGQYSRLTNQWLDVEGSEKLDNKLMGGKPKGVEINFESQLLKDLLNKIHQADPKRCKEVVAFYADYQRSIDNVSRAVRKGGYACYVVGNRRVKGVTLETDEITREFFEANGFEHVETAIRSIPNKRMPSKNSPTNIPGQLDTTMTNEYIVVMKKV